MRQYISTLHKKPDHIKRRFAFLVSASFTLSIFTIWSLVNFGLPSKSEIAAKKNNSSEESLLGGMALALKAISGTLNETKQGLEQVDTSERDGNMVKKVSDMDIYGR